MPSPPMPLSFEWHSWNVLEVERFVADIHLDGVIRLCAAEGWSSSPANPSRASRVLTHPGSQPW